MYIDAEKLKAEVERIRQDWLGDSTGLEVGEIGAAFEAAESILDSIDNIIDSLQQEQPEVELEEEIEKELRSHYNDDQDVYWWNYLKNSFRHFYELGLNTRKK